MGQTRITDETDSLIEIFPQDIAQNLIKANHTDLLIEVYLDLGRVPMARFVGGEEVPLSDHEVTRDVLENVIQKVGKFDSDNRTGIEKTLHRISAIYNRKKEIVGLTCRVGRAVYGMVDIIEDYLLSGKNILILGAPGVGKTTMLREASRILAEHKKRVIVVDSSNEIGGDGDIPHPAIGKARRMQVYDPTHQHRVMIEAIENHNPEVIVVDEIGKRDEAAAARTIAERGVQLIATAHGHTLENLLMNPTLSDLVGGVDTVVLSDEEAQRRGTQKTVRERKSPPTFDVLVEIVSFTQVNIHPSIADSVDALLRDCPVEIEYRYWNEKDEIVKERRVMQSETGLENTIAQIVHCGQTGRKNGSLPDSSNKGFHQIYPVGVSRKLLNQCIAETGVPVVICKSFKDANSVIITKAKRRAEEVLVQEAERRRMQILVIPSSKAMHIRDAITRLF